MTAKPILEVTDLRIQFTTPQGIAEVVNGVNLSIAPGQVHGLVGESGSGKSVTARAVLGILPRKALHLREGSVRFAGEEILGLGEDQMRERIRGRRIAMVFQDPMTALNPVMRVGKQLVLPIRRHLGLSAKAAKERAIDLLGQVGIPDPIEKFKAYPHQLSGGQRQRIMIALALSCDPELLIADEPTTALDVTVQAQILDLFDKLRRERNLAVLLVSHDLSLIAERCDAVSVMYAGRVVETGSAISTFEAPQHPYTKALEEARPSLDNPPHTLLRTIPGRPPQLTDLPHGCSYANRCPRMTELCLDVDPPLEPGPAGRPVACHHPVAGPNESLDGAGAAVTTERIPR
ncbi:ABC transporter ATP-binding protein [Salinibacterium hongtaonis]|uniref:ABC transporter ATP-binding protein n=1 Tax=Homoserinimonas hongtaonis TaxID=2079791 RepID=UPI000D3845C2|nr:ABC transporter ATP-binding protein [Salinibacterium hongtaonis]AWB90217.1 peptide ABC transporter ATP-binding protein [Salinibacterium hongtaonis]